MKDRINLYNLLKRPEVNIKQLKCFITNKYSREVLEQVEIINKYEGYIKKEEKEAERMNSYEKLLISENIDYKKVANLATEAREKLIKVRPTTIGQAMRISGVNPSDISMLMIYLKRIKQ